MAITTEKTDEFKDKVEEFVRNHLNERGPVCQEKFLVEVCKYAEEQSSNYIPQHLELVQEHKTGMIPSQLDYNMVFLSAVLISWAVRMRKVKSNEGQCHTHLKNCVDTRKMHSKIYDEWIRIIQETLDALKKDRPGQ